MMIRYILIIIFVFTAIIVDAQTPGLVIDTVVKKIYLTDLLQERALTQPELESVYREGEPRIFQHQQRPAWVVYLLLAVTAAIAWLLYSYPKDFTQYRSAFFSINIGNQLHRSQEATTGLFSLSFFLLHLVVTSFFLMLAIGYLDLILPWPPWRLFLILMVFILGLQALKWVVIKIISLVFSFGKELSLITFHSILINKVMTFGLWILIILFTFLPVIFQKYIFWAGCILIAILLIIKYLRALLLAGSFIRFHKFHFFLYICTLEVAPVLLIIKWVQRHWIL